MSNVFRSIRVPQQRRSLEKRAKLVETAYHVFSSQGYHGTSTNNIVRASGLSTGTLYAYFQNKKQLFLEAVHLHYSRFFTRLEGVLAQIDLSDTEVLKTLLPSTLYSDPHALSFHRELIALVFTDPEVQRAYYEQQETLIDLVQGHLAARNVEVSREAAFLMVSVVTIVGREFLFHPETTLDRDRLDDLSGRVAQQLLELPKP